MYPAGRYLLKSSFGGNLEGILSAAKCNEKAVKTQSREIQLPRHLRSVRDL